MFQMINKIMQKNIGIQKQNDVCQSGEGRFVGYLGFGSKSWAAIWETILFGILIFGFAIAFGYTFQAGTSFNLNRCLILSTILSSAMIGYLLYKLHGPYKLEKKNNRMLGDLRSNKMQNKLIGFCIAFVLVMSAPVIGTLLVQNSQNDRDTIFGFCIAFIVEILLGICGHLITNYNQSNQSSSSSQNSMSSTNNNINFRPSLNIHQHRQIVIPSVAYFRDFLITLVNLCQTLTFISLVFVPLALVHINSPAYILDSKGFCQFVDFSSGKNNFTFKNINIEGQNPQNGWIIVYPNGTETQSLSKNSPITQQFLREFISLDPNNPNFPEQSRLIRERMIIDINESNSINFTTFNDLKIAANTTMNPVNGTSINQQLNRISHILNRRNFSYLFDNKIQLLKWRSPTSSAAPNNHFEYYWQKRPGYRGLSIINFTVVLPVSFTQAKLYLQQSYAQGVQKFISKVEEITNNTKKFIQFGPGVYDRMQNRFMYNIKENQTNGLSFSTQNRRGDTYNWKLNEFRNMQNNIIPVTQVYIDQDNRSTAVIRRDAGYEGQVIAVFLNSFDWNRDCADNYFQWANLINFVGFKTTKTYTHLFDTNNSFKNGIIKFYIVFVFLAATLSCVIYGIWNSKCNNQKYILLNNGRAIQQRYAIPHSALNHIQTLTIFAISGITLFTLPINYQQCYPTLIKTNLIFATLISTVLYLIVISPQNSNTIRHNGYKYLCIFQYSFNKINIRKALEQIGIRVNDQLCNFVVKSGYTHYFLNSFRVREVLRQHSANLAELQNRLSQFVKLELLDLNKQANQETIVADTFRIISPISLTSLCFLCCSMLYKINQIQLNFGYETMLGVFAAVSFINVCYILWKCRYESFIKNGVGQVHHRPTQALDLIKIGVLVLLIQGCLIGSILVGLSIAQSFSLVNSDRFLIAFFSQSFGIIIGVFVHWIWNKTSGVMA